MTNTPDFSLPEKPLEFPVPPIPQKLGIGSTITKEKVETFLDLLRRGNVVKTASRAIGHSAVGVMAWVEKGNALIESGRNLDEMNVAEQLYVYLASEIEVARATAQVNAIEVVRKAAAKGNIQAATWFLERSDPENWGRVIRQEITGEGGGAVQVDVDAVSRKLEALAQNLIIDADVLDSALDEPEVGVLEPPVSEIPDEKVVE
jgi:hypothetical protein